MRLIEEMCEVQLQDEVVKLRNQTQWLRNSLIRIKRCIETDDTTYALAIVLQTLEATREEKNETSV